MSDQRVEFVTEGYRGPDFSTAVAHADKTGDIVVRVVREEQIVYPPTAVEGDRK